MTKRASQVIGVTLKIMESIVEAETRHPCMVPSLLMYLGSIISNEEDSSVPDTLRWCCFLVDRTTILNSKASIITVPKVGI